MFSIQQSGQTQQHVVPEKAYLKPERVQEMLLKLPGWKLGAEGQAILRRRHFTSLKDTQAFVRLVSRLSAKYEQPVKIALYGKRVDLTLAGRAPKRLNDPRLTMDVFNLASQIG